MRSDEPVTIIGIGPLTNLAEALTRKPEIAKRAKFVGMQGSVYRGYGGSQSAHVSSITSHAIAAAKKVFSADWKDMIITPLDTCTLVPLRGAEYKSVYNCNAPLTKAVIDNYRVFLNGANPENESTVLFDTVAIFFRSRINS